MQIKVIRRKQLNSTSTYLKELVLKGASEGLVVMAEEQTEGRGKQGSPWVSKPGNLYFSLFLSPQRPLEEAAQLSFMTALAVVRTLKSWLNPQVEIKVKWPNDVLIEGKKVSGILLESLAEGNICDKLIVGVGINLLTHPCLANYPTTCLQEYCEEVPLLRTLFTSALRHLIQLYIAWQRGGFLPIRQEWLTYSYPLGHQVKAIIGSTQLRGTFQGIEDNGQLLLSSPEGILHKLSTGEVFF